MHSRRSADARRCLLWACPATRILYGTHGDAPGCARRNRIGRSRVIYCSAPNVPDAGGTVRDQTRLGLLALGVAALLGLLGDLLLRAIPWGLNAPLWIALLVLAVAILVRLAKLPLLGEARW